MHTPTNLVHDRRRRAYEHVPFGASDRTRRRTSRLTLGVVAASVAVAGLIARSH